MSNSLYVVEPSLLEEDGAVASKEDAGAEGSWLLSEDEELDAEGFEQEKHIPLRVKRRTGSVLAFFKRLPLCLLRNTGYEDVPKTIV